MHFVGLLGIIVTLLFSVSYSTPIQAAPTLQDKSLKLELVADGLAFPTSVAFIKDDDFLVLELNGTVQRIVNGSKLGKPLIDLDVSTGGGALGIAYLREIREGIQSRDFDSSHNKSQEYVFIYYDESEVGDCDCPPVATRLYRYDLTGNGMQLVNPIPIISLPSDATGVSYPILHEGGPIKIGPDGHVYLAAGDSRSILEKGRVDKNKAVNYEDGSDPDGRAGILRFTPDGAVVDRKGILGDNYPLNLYYAYGIRNIFGFAFDPLSGEIWDTENGPDYGDEINLVEPGFNSGWGVVMGFQHPNSSSLFDGVELPKTFEDFDGKGKYRDPEFVWNDPIGVTALQFLDTSKYGEEYENDMLVGDANFGNLYHFDLNENRSKLILNGSLADKVADTKEEREELPKLGEGFGTVTDMQIGPDGYLYIVSGREGGKDSDEEGESEGKIFRIVPFN
jgi:glucose/arabinose dehydrogenase